MPYGTLEVVIEDAKDLYNTNHLTKMNPYVIITCKTDEKRTSVAKGEGKTPEWNESFLFTITNDVTQIKLKLYDKDRFTKDDLIGEAIVPLKHHLFDRGSLPTMSYNVVDVDGEYHGEINVALNFTHDGH